MIEVIRLSEKGKRQLIQLKRKTGLEQWNTLCRWAFCMSLAEPSVPPEEDIPANSNVEMSWKTFAGEYQLVYSALLSERLIEDGVIEGGTNKWFRIHLHRGISYLNQQVSDIKDVVTSVAD